MNSRNNLNLGDEIKNIVQDALNNQNFNELNRDIGNVVKDALAEAKGSVNWKINKQTNSNKNWNSNTENQNIVHVKETQNLRDLQTISPMKKNTSLAVRRTKYQVPVGKVSGLLLTSIGTIGSSLFGVAIVVLAILGFTMGNFFHAVNFILLPFFLLSIFGIYNGNRISKRLKRFNKYLLCMEGRDYCSIDELASLTGASSRFVEKDLRKMISSGMFPEGHIDNKKTTFILTNERYKQYLELKYLEVKQNIANKGLKQKEELSFLNAAEEYEMQREDKGKINPEIRKSLDEGRRFIAEIKAANVAIPDEEISSKLDRLEIVIGKIFDYVEIHPEKFDEIKKFTEYFLPTTFKLVDVYKNLDNQSIQGENISNAKREIEDTLDTINLAFENLLDDLFHDISMDISTDISVLETMLAQAGLTQNEMRIKNDTIEEDKNE